MFIAYLFHQYFFPNLKKIELRRMEVELATNQEYRIKVIENQSLRIMVLAGVAEIKGQELINDNLVNHIVILHTSQSNSLLLSILSQELFSF